MQSPLRPSTPRVLRLRRNDIGRDFIVGDIHGAYDMVVEAMRLVRFNPSRDRLLAVGDLVNRGPDSWRCLRFLQQPYVFSVRGNHDQNLVALYSNGEPSQTVLDFMAARCGMNWWLDTPEDVRREILRALAKLPIVIEVETRRGLVGILHGNVPANMGWANFINHVERGHIGVIDEAIQGRTRILAGDQSGVLGVGRVFVGHTPQRGGPKRYGNVYAVDTGAIFNLLMGKDHYCLTMANIAASTLPLAVDGEGKVARILAIAEPEEGRPFGMYAREQGGPVY
ncbi:metallophosphoesterase [Rubrivivax gelatinosus]|uniref:metallophosphoesterase n=1 Tax=Rubrivivax gelatinosus TaxID=28068 RepID=UPI0006826DC6|nr:metallophosphoesterase [Rubrivivax gelatinosus]MBG6083088.1 serine/threonine protein phosphatase 1 [Rubrivivax gelatinosus]